MKKLKLILIAFVALILAGAAIGATLAYFTDRQSSQNTSTAGSVKVQFTELDANGTVVNLTNNSQIINYGTIYPGREIKKDSTITVQSGSENAYLAAQIVITDGAKNINSILSSPDSTGTGTKLDSFFEGGAWADTLTQTTINGKNMWQGNNFTVYYDPSVQDGFVVYVFVNAEKEANDSVVFLESLLFPAAWGNEEFANCTDLKLDISVYAAQAAGFNSCIEAMYLSFPDQFQAFQ